MPSWSNISSLSAARAKVLKHDHQINLNDQFEHCRNIKVKALEGWKSRIVVEILLNIDARHLSEAEGRFQEAIEADKRNGMMWQLAKDYASYAEVFKRKGDRSKAIDRLNMAIEIFKECGADGWVEKYEIEFQQTLD